jgi:hypothetical protein
MIKAVVVAAILFFLPTIAKSADSLESRALPMSFEVKGGVVVAVGIFWTNTADNFSKLEAEYKLDHTVIVFDSNGGMVQAALELGRRIRSLHMHTAVGAVDAKGHITPNGTCLSMCPFVLLAGITRRAEIGTIVGVHQIGIHGATETDSMIRVSQVSVILRDIGKLATYAHEMGASSELLAMALSTPPYGMRTLTQEEMRTSGLLK